jgi:hypothetical protein
MMGMEGGMPGMGGTAAEEDMANAPEPPADGEAAPAEAPKKKKKFNPFDVVKDVVKDQLP